MHLNVPHRPAPGSGSNSLSGRAWVWAHQFELDRELAEGADPTSSPALQTRARRLQRTDFRRGLVAQIDAALAKAEHPPHWHSASLPVRALEVRSARETLQALRQVLTAPGAPCVQGLALAACLLNDHHGPLYDPCTGGDIAQRADVATSALAAQPQRHRDQAGSGQPPPL